MLSVFSQILPTGSPAALACIAGVVIGLRLERAGLVGLAILLGSFGLFAAIVFVFTPMLGDYCYTDAGPMIINLQTLAAFGLSWLLAFGAGMLAAKIWKTNRIAGVSIAIVVTLASIPFSYLAVWDAAFVPGCYI